MDTPEHEPLWGVTDVARYLNVKRSTIYKWNAAGVGPAPIRVGSLLRWRPETVRAWLRELEQATSEAVS